MVKIDSMRRLNKLAMISSSKKVNVGVVAQLEEQSFPIPEARNLNQVIGKIYNQHIIVNLKKTK